MLEWCLSAETSSGSSCSCLAERRAADMPAFCWSANGERGGDITRGQCSAAANAPSLLGHTLILCFLLPPCHTEIGTSAHAVMITPDQGSRNVRRYVNDYVQVWLQQNVLLGCSLASFYLKRLRHSFHDSIQCWSLHCTVACIIAFFPLFLCCAFNWEMLAVGLSSRSRLLEWK